jgi:aryl-alcohol dehydrogenase-like predicted oxidoreductase
MGATARLGRSGLTVSTLCFGTGYMSGPVAAGARLLTRAYELGVTFWDTSDDYGTHPHVARALRDVGRDEIVEHGRGRAPQSHQGAARAPGGGGRYLPPPCGGLGR